VFELFYLEGLGGRELCERIRDEGQPEFSAADLAEILQKLDSQLDPRTRRRMAFDLKARSVGATSGRLLDFFQRAEIEFEMKQDAEAPDHGLQREETESLLQRVRSLLRGLPEVERSVIELRYYRKQTARQTAEQLNLEGQRRVYTLEGKALRNLRTQLDP